MRASAVPVAELPGLFNRVFRGSFRGMWYAL